MKHEAQNKDWYALLVPPQREFNAQDILKRHGVTTFVPFESKWRFSHQHTRHKSLKNYPLMPRYVFAGFPEGEPVPWWYILELDAITGVVGLRGMPLKIYGVGEMMGRFKNGLKRPEVEKHMRSGKEYRAGEEAIILDPRFRERVIVVDEIRGNHAFFKLELFNGVHQIRLPVGSLEAV